VSFKACTQLSTEFFIFHISIRMNCNRISEGFLYFSAIMCIERHIVTYTRPVIMLYIHSKGLYRLGIPERIHMELLTRKSFRN
jgi:hypothetical protein